ncbi:MAG: polyprenyl synthetase family protein [Candidatus Daviesbacteria bacterium]|nr:polyprenyl synthetase family protein [Candidatus Daviesbacteria bacterium]
MDLEAELNKLLDDFRKEAGRIDRALLPPVDKFIKANQGGKRIRGKLVVLGFQLAAHLRGENVRWNKAHPGGEILKVAAAYEIFHTALLAHDDIIDKDLIRRGQPSLYQALGGDHRGTSLAISLADAGFFLAIKIISEANFPEKEKNEALKYFSNTALQTVMGQILDIDVDCDSPRRLASRIIDKGDYFKVALYKTAKYSVSGPLILGAILGGAKSHLGGVRAHLRGGQLFKNLAKFGENLGVAFQIKDDILDNEVAWTGGLDSAKNEAKKYENRAMKVLPRITGGSNRAKDKKMSKLLQQMAAYLVQRTK